MNRPPFFAAVSCAVLLLYPSKPILPQTLSPVGIQSLLNTKVNLPAEKLSFAEALNRLHTTYKINIIAAGVPHLAEAKVPEAKTLEQALEAIASAFDYQWTVDKRGVVLLTKAFRKEEDYPQLDEAWMRYFAKTNRDILQTVSSGDTFWADDVVTLAKMLQPEQWLVLQSGANLPATSLTAPQLQQMQRTAINNNLHRPKQHWQRLWEFMSGINKVKIQLVSNEISGQVANAAPYIIRVFDARSSTEPVYELTALGWSEFKEYSLDAPRRLDDTSVLDEERGREYPKGVEGRWSKQIQISASETTLSQLLPLLSMQNELSFSAEPYLLSRRYTIYCQMVSKRAITDALAVLEDWHWREDASGGVFFSPRLLRETNNVLAIPRRLQAVLPRDFRDYLCARRPSLTATKMIPSQVADPPGNKMSRFNHQSRSIGYLMLKRLMEQLAVSKKADEPIPLSKLTDEERHALMYGILRDAFRGLEFRLYGGDFPLYIIEPQIAYLELHGNQLEISVSQRDAAGGVSTTGFGAGVASVIPKQHSDPSDASKPKK